ncbi:hypothetical protein [Verrucomicrobium spinosum]|uniref:hypothetical protein n=1 Tax=Verrucomicrobium spinosum TaxID=2736 RepID=UPI0012E1568C|nr:hypothetical protein [Verrucomicrobium spinosum]
MDAIEQLLPISSLSVDQVNPLDLSMKHIDDRYTEALPEIHEVVPQPVHDHPGVQHLIKHGPRRCNVCPISLVFSKGGNGS